MATSELMLREDEVRARRRRVHRAGAIVLAAAALGLAGVAAAKQAAPEAFEAATAVFVLGFTASLLAAWRTLRRHWRCPACDVRWEWSDSLASSQWNHCAACGAALRAHPKQRDRERVAHTEFALEALPHDELVARFVRRRRRGLLAVAAVAIAAVATLLWVQSRGLGELAEQAVVALFAGVALGLGVMGARCPRCRVGVIAGRDRHCQRCGLLLRSDLEAAPDRPPEA